MVGEKFSATVEAAGEDDEASTEEDAGAGAGAVLLAAVDSSVNAEATEELDASDVSGKPDATDAEESVETALLLVVEDEVGVDSSFPPQPVRTTSATTLRARARFMWPPENVVSRSLVYKS